MFDLIIKNGTVVDGSGNPWYQADIGVKGKRIVAMGDLTGQCALRVINAKDKIVAPGFIDVHSHSDYLILGNPTAESKVAMGVTTDISGNCAGSAAPQNKMFWQEWWTEDVDERFKLVTREYAAETLKRHGIVFDWRTMQEYFDRVEKKGISINYGNIVGHYTLRIAAYHQERRKPTDDEMQLMMDMLAQAMDEGALGFSTEVGSHFVWEYDIQEVIDLCKVAKAKGGIFSYDIAEYGDKMLEWLETALWVIDQAQIPTIISHINVYGRENAGKAHYVLDMIEAARKRGLDVVADVMPYATGGGLFFSARATDMLPQWAIDNLEATLASPDARQRLKPNLT